MADIVDSPERKGTWHLWAFSPRCWFSGQHSKLHDISLHLDLHCSFRYRHRVFLLEKKNTLNQSPSFTLFLCKGEEAANLHR